MLDKTGGRLQQNVDEAMDQARQLASERKFIQALEMLASWSRQDQPEEYAAAVKALEEEIRAQQAQESEMQVMQEKEALDAQWQKALEMFDHRQFDQSIVLFEELVDTPYQGQARAKISEAVNLAATELRKEAASLFIKARKTNDVDQKKALLLESRRLLLLVQQKYPQADIIDKVRQNQKATEDQLRALEPNLPTE